MTNSEPKHTDVKCKNCNKTIGKLNTEGKPSFRTLREGVTEYNGLFCNQKCLKEFEEKNKEDPLNKIFVYTHLKDKESILKNSIFKKLSWEEKKYFVALHKNENDKDKEFRDFKREIRKWKKIGKTFPRGLSQVRFEYLAHWLNRWGDVECHARYEQEDNQKPYRRGYHQCVRDIFDFLKINFRLLDKRTKTGFKK